MHYTYFQIRNFKGIHEARLDLAPNPGIYTLVGLNESGKTTILEAISLIYKSGDDSPSGSGAADDPRAFIPLRQSADFTGKIEINAEIAFTEDERQILVDSVTLPKGTRLDLGSAFRMERHFVFERGEFKEEDSGLVIAPYKVTPKRRVILTKAEKDSLVNAIFARLPQVLFFPNFLVDIPEKIYVDLATALPESVNAINKYYTALTQDIIVDPRI